MPRRNERSGMAGDTQLQRRGGDAFERSSILDDPRQRAVLSVLLEHSEPLTVRDLAVQIAARETGGSPPAVTENDYRSIRVDLHHRCLPKLHAVGWIERLSEGSKAASPLPFGEPDSSLPSLDAPDVRWDQLAAVLARPHRRDLLSVLVGADQPLGLGELAGRLAAHDRRRWTIDGDEDTLATVLHHVDLPALEAAGLLRYDPDEKTLTQDRALVMKCHSLVSVLAVD